MEIQTVFDVKEAAEYLSCSISSIRTLVRECKIPNYRIGTKILFRKNSLDEWIKQQETKI